MSGETLSERVTLTNRYGLHARPAALFVETCNAFQCEVTVVKEGIEVNGKNILDIMMLGAEPGCELELRTSGPDAKAAMERLLELIRKDFGETHDAD
jgi:phosphocarrier protein